MKIFITHYKPLIDRKIHIENELKKHNLTSNTEFILDFDREELEKLEGASEVMKKFDRNILNNTKISLLLKHFEIYKKVSNSEDDYVLILEDDVILGDNFVADMNNYIKQLPDEWDMCFLGDGCNLHIDNEIILPNVNIYRHHGSKCTDSYLITKKCANKMIENFNYMSNINLPIDCLLNNLIRDNHFNSFWVEPTIVTQGSQRGLFITTIQNPNDRYF